MNSIGYLLQLCEIGIFSSIFLPPLRTSISDVRTYHTICWKNAVHSIDAKLAGHVNQLDVKLQSLCASGFCLFAVGMLTKPYHFGVNLPTTLCENKDGVHLFTLNFQYHNRYKLLFCNSENGVVAWRNVNNTEWGFVFFLITKTCFFSKKQKTG